jgi:hypothetical protein
MRKTEPDSLSKIRKNCKGAIASGAQTERPGLGGLVRDLGKDSRPLFADLHRPVGVAWR